jgi:single-strand DNA-binding protein
MNAALVESIEARMETQIEGAAMQSLLGHGEANGITPLLCAFERDYAEWKTGDAVCEMRLFVPRSDGEKVDLVCRGMALPGSGSSVVLEVCLPVPFLTSSVTASGLMRRPAALRRSAFRTPLPEQVWAPAPECTAWHLGVAPTRIASQGVTRADREFKNGDTIMYQNKAILIGFLGGDAEVRTGKNNQKFTTLSLATKTSYKDKESGEYISHTEWHRSIVFGKLGEFAATLKKGAHIQIEGEIRHTEYTPKKAKKPVRTDSIRVNSILKLDRAEKAAAEEQEANEELPFDEAVE